MKKELDQNRRDADAWALDWQIRNRNRKYLTVAAVIVIIALLAAMVHFIVIRTTRATFSSEEEMRAALQGRFVCDRYEDIVIDGDTVQVTYYDISHYDQDFAEKYGYGEYGDSVYDDIVVQWDYRHGAIKLKWMEDIIVDKKGNLQRYSQTFVKTDKPKPEPIDPSVLSNGNKTEGSEELTDEEQSIPEEVQDSLEETEEMAEEAGILNATGGSDEQTEGNQD